MQARHHTIVEALRGARIEDDADAVIRGLQDDAAALRESLRDPQLTRIVLVTLPEALSVEETLDAAAHFEKIGIPLAQVVVNRLTLPPPDRCAWCGARRAIERAAISTLARGLQPCRPLVSAVGAAEREPVGVRALFRLARELDRPLPSRSGGFAAASRRRFSASLPGAAAAATLQVPGRLLMFGGKGGVGKTTCAAAAALHIARHDTGRRVLLVSIDPAHSLADVLGHPVSDRPRRLPGSPANLEVRELDAAAAFAAFRAEYAAAIDAVFTRLSRGSVDVQHDHRVLNDLLELAPPGLDEIVAVLGAADLLLPGTYDLLIVDTAPTGHAIRLLETPATIQDWVKALMSIVLKYQSVIGVGELGAALLSLAQRLGAFRKLLADARQAHFVIVTRLARLPHAETVRLEKSLARLRVHVPAVVVNAAGAGTCRRCRRTARAEWRELSGLVTALRARAAGLPVIVTPATVPPPAGVPALTSWIESWRALAAGDG
jgi:arsenite-transporting ATPase